MLIALVGTIVLCILFYTLAQIGILYRVEKTPYLKRQLDNTMQQFQIYVSDNNVKCSDYDKIMEWNRKNNFISLKIYNRNTLIYDTFLPHETGIILDDIKQTQMPYQHEYQIQFSDATVDILVTPYFESRYKKTINATSFGMSLILFILLFTLLLRKKIRYIKELEEGIKIIESGSLEYELPIEGNDELTSLALSINQMSRAMNERINWEEEAKYINYKLISSMSHDIRTPLTSVICYLDLIEAKKYDSVEKLQEYIKNARIKAYQIKGLTDKLFEHSLSSNEETVFTLERFNGNELIAQLVSENIYTLEDKSFTVNYIDKIYELFHIRVDIQQIRRVFENIFSNIYKYADKSVPVDVILGIEDGRLVFTEHNKTAAFNKDVESFGLGLQTCRNIVRRHDGEINIQQNENSFIITVYLPIEQK